MNERVGVLAVVALFALSGCLGAAGPGTVDGTDWNSDPANHWQSEVVAVSHDAPDDRDYDPLVAEALAFWSEHAEEYAGFDVELRQVDDRESADVHVSFVETVGDCGAHVGEELAGCAPVLESADQVDPPVDVEVRTGLDDPSTVRVLRHELGHTLGLTHDDEPQAVMGAHLDLDRLSVANASERPNPWQTDELAVHADLGALDGEERDEVARQIDAALEYYDSGADGTVPREVTFRRSDDPDGAHVVVEYVETAGCRDDPGSCGAVRGDDVDGDGEFDYHTGLDVVLVDLDPAATGWHVGRWLGTAFAPDHDEAYPEPLRQASFEDRRSEWWD